MSQRSMDSKQVYDTPSPIEFLPSYHGEAGQISQSRDLVRPPIEYSSFNGWLSSVWARWKSLWTRRFIFSLIAGQVVSLCITVTNVTTTELVDRNWSLSTTQTWFLWVFTLPLGGELTLGFVRYFSLFMVYTPYTMYRCTRFRLGQLK